MSRGREYKRHSKKVTSTKRWRALRLQILRRDNWQCQKCGSKANLEIDHIKPVREAPKLAFGPCNLQVLCKRCHSSKTRLEVHGKPLSPERERWRDFVLST